MNKTEPQAENEKSETSPAVELPTVSWHAAGSGSFFRLTMGTFTLSLLSAFLVVLVLIGFSFGLDVANNWDTSNMLAGVWTMILPVVTFLVGMLVAVGLPVAVMYNRGVRRVLLVIALEAGLLLIALIGVGLFINATAGGNGTYTSTGACGTSLSGGQICNY